MKDQGYHNNSLAVHPFEPNTVFVGGVHLYRINITDVISNAGTFKDKRMKSPTRTTDFEINVDGAAHVDHHVIHPIIVDLQNEEFWIFNANDGGVAVSQSNGLYFNELDRNGSGFNTSQFYGIAKKPGESVYIGGTQDNGTSLSQYDPESDSDWERVIGGDGFDAIWHKTNSELVLGTAQYSKISKSTDGGHSFTTIMSRDKQNGQFFTTLASSDLSPHEVYTTKKDGVYYSLDFGDTWNHTPLDGGCGNGKIKVSKANPSIVWALCGLEDNLGFLSKDHGKSFYPLSEEHEFTGFPSGLATHSHEPATAYVLFSHPNYPKILETTDYGETWTDLSGFGKSDQSNNGFPDVAVYDLIVMPHAPNTLWVGTEIGLFRSSDRGQSWHYVDDGLPPVAIWQMKIRDNEVILGTHGRGVWTIKTSEIQTFAFTSTIDNLDLPIGVHFEIQLPELIGGQKPLTYTISPDLPDGLSFNSSTRTLSGKPTTITKSSEYIYMVRDSNSNMISTYFNITTGRSAIHKNLIFLYNSTNGDQWTDNSGWDKNQVPKRVDDFDQWHGITTGNGEILGIYLENNNLIGDIPSELGNLSSLEFLSLQDNQLTGEIPTELGNLYNLGTLNLSYNQLAGEIPIELGNLSNLENLLLSSNQLTGNIPSELANLTNLWQLSLAVNQLTGEIPIELGNLSNLENLQLAVNQLTGEIPAELGNLSKLRSRLSLQGNQLTGEIPAELGNLSNLSKLFLSYNQLTGQIPNELGSLSNLSRLNISYNQLSGVLPQSFSQLRNLRFLNFDANSGLCSPPSPEFQNWLNSIENVSGNTCTVSFSSQIAPQSYPRSTPISPLILPALDSGQPPIQYTLNLLDLPLGLNFDATNRSITGTPTQLTPPVQMIYKATDNYGFQDSLKFTVEIVSPVSSHAFESLPTEFFVHSNYPNPFNSSTKLRIDLPYTARVEVEVFDLTGRRVYLHSPLNLSAGWNREIHLTEVTLSAGVYVYRLTVNSPDGVSNYSGRFVHSQ